MWGNQGLRCWIVYGSSISHAWQNKIFDSWKWLVFVATERYQFFVLIYLITVDLITNLVFIFCSKSICLDDQNAEINLYKWIGQLKIRKMNLCPNILSSLILHFDIWMTGVINWQKACDSVELMSFNPFFTLLNKLKLWYGKFSSFLRKLWCTKKRRISL